jgi:chaperonin GroES
LLVVDVELPQYGRQLPFRADQAQPTATANTPDIRSWIEHLITAFRSPTRLAAVSRLFCVVQRGSELTQRPSSQRLSGTRSCEPSTWPATVDWGDTFSLHHRLRIGDAIDHPMTFVDDRGETADSAFIGTPSVRAPNCKAAALAPLASTTPVVPQCTGYNPMTFRPLHDRVLVRRVEAEAKTAGGIIIPDTAQEKPQEGEVISAGSGARSDDGAIIPLDVKAGDRILFGKWSGTEVKVGTEDLLIMKESDILGIVQ